MAISTITCYEILSDVVGFLIMPLHISQKQQTLHEKSYFVDNNSQKLKIKLLNFNNVEKLKT